MKHLLSLFVALVVTTILEAQNNIITYTAPSKLPEYEYYFNYSSVPHGLHTNCFNTVITSHTFQDGVGTITFFSDVTEIGHFAFGWSDITSVNLPSTVTKIGEYAFDGCDLTTFTMPDAVTYIDNWSFANCHELTSITFGKSLKTIGGSAFESCGKLTAIELPDSLLSIFGHAFAGCVHLASVTFGKSLKTIEYHAFESCYDLKSIVLPNSLIEIGEAAFNNCTSLESVVMGNSVEEIGAHGFNWCHNLSSINLSTSLKSIGNYAFLVNNLSSITLPASLTKIGDGVFGQSDLTSIICLASTPPICGSSCFTSLMVSSGTLYVPAESMDAYKTAYGWKALSIAPIEAENILIADETPIVNSTNNEITISWPIIDEASTYTLAITKDKVLVQTLTFNAQGQLLNIAFAAPSHDGSRQVPAAILTTQGYQFTVTGLDPGTSYEYSIVATDAEGETIAEHTGNFSTTGGATTNINRTQDTKHRTLKYLHNGQLIIDRNGKHYSAMGERIR